VIESIGLSIVACLLLADYSEYSKMTSKVPDADEPTILLQAEDLKVARRSVAGDTVRVETTTRTRDHHIDEPLSHNRVQVERVPIGRTVAAVPPVREEGDTTILPVVEEVIVVERRLILKEEVHIRRVQVADCHTETVTTREQTAEIHRTGADSPESKNNRPPLSETTTSSQQEQNV
jgi:uncharacterized protein (TIGR02271 family)